MLRPLIISYLKSPPPPPQNSNFAWRGYRLVEDLARINDMLRMNNFLSENLWLACPFRYYFNLSVDQKIQKSLNW